MKITIHGIHCPLGTPPARLNGSCFERAVLIVQICAGRRVFEADEIVFPRFFNEPCIVVRSRTYGFAVGNAYGFVFPPVDKLDGLRLSR
ncbi:MAG: hypothetical protein U0X91_22475 [Spirosomataceae bacterium]